MLLCTVLQQRESGGETETAADKVSFYMYLDFKNVDVLLKNTPPLQIVHVHAIVFAIAICADLRIVGNPPK